MSLVDQIKEDMYAAMKAGEKEKSKTLRTAFAKLKDRRIEKRENLTETEAIKVIQTLVKQRKESVDLYTKGGRNDLAAEEASEIVILETFLPQMMDKNEIEALVQSAIKDLNITDMTGMGKVMQEVMKRGKGLVDGKIAQDFVRGRLG